MMNNLNSRQGKVFDDCSNPDISLYFAAYNDIDDLCNVINWAYRGKPSTSSPGEYYSGWVTEQHLLEGLRITSEELKRLIDDEQHNIIVVAKIKINSMVKIVGCCKISIYDKSLQITDDEKQDVAIEFGLNAVDPDYQSRGIGTLMFNGAIHLAKEYFNAQRVYCHIICSKRNQIEWRLRQGFIDSGRLIPFPFPERFKSHINPDEAKFCVLTKRLE